eukprot:gene2651-3068_t
MDTGNGKLLSASKMMRELCQIFKLDSYYIESLDKRKKQLEIIENVNEQNLNHIDKKMKVDEIVYKNIRFIKNEFPKTITPKMILHEHVKRQKWKSPQYMTEISSDRLYKSVVTIDEKKYGGTAWEKSKQAAEQAAAMVYLHMHSIHDGRKEA